MAKLPGREVTFSFKTPIENESDDENPLDIRLFVDMNVGIGGDIWPAAQCFCQWILLKPYFNFFSTLFDNKRILELGSGNALVSILVEKAFKPKEVVVTDLLSHVPHIVHNLEMNHCSISHGAALDWMDESSSLGEPFDIVLALEW